MKRRDDMFMYDDPNEAPFVRDLLQAGRRANAEYDVERGLAEHLARIAATATAPTWTATATKSALPAWIGYVAMPLAAATVAATLWVFSSSPKSDEPARLPPSGEAPAPAVVPPANAEAQASLHPTSAERPELAAANASERRASRIAARPSHSPSRAARSAASSRGAAESPAATGDVEAIAPETAAAPDVAANPYTTESSAVRAPQPAREAESAAAARAPEAHEQAAQTEEPHAEKPAAAKPAPKPVIDEARLEREMQMLAVTQRVLGSDPQRALRLAQQGEREFPSTMFSAERRQLALLAMVKLGRLDEARRAGRPFLARYPNAPWSERLRRALATGRVE